MFSLPLSSFLFLVLCLWLSLSLFFLILTHHLHFSISLSCSRAVSYYFYAYPSLPSLPHLPLFLPLPRSLALPPWLPSLFFFLSLALSLSLQQQHQDQLWQETTRRTTAISSLLGPSRFITTVPFARNLGETRPLPRTPCMPKRPKITRFVKYFEVFFQYIQKKNRSTYMPQCIEHKGDVHDVLTMHIKK